METTVVRDDRGRFVKGYSAFVETQLKKGQHWRNKKPYWEKAWLVEHYQHQKKSALEIAEMFGVTENAIFYWLDKHNVKRRTMREIREIKHWGCSGPDNPMWNRKGSSNPNWRGGVSPERQAFYSSEAWKNVCSMVWQRDGATCQKCGVRKHGEKDMEFHIHHIRSFANEKLRANADNLILLCKSCHHWVHSRRNKHGEYIQGK